MNLWILENLLIEFSKNGMNKEFKKKQNVIKN